MHLRRHLRLWAAVSLILQSAWLFALVPNDCCATHVVKAESCHEEVTPAPHCPMKDSTGAACPMHRSDESHPARKDCSMRGSCSGPMSALMTLLANHGVLPNAAPGLTAPAARIDVPDTHEQLIPGFVPPDSPPPRV